MILRECNSILFWSNQKENTSDNTSVFPDSFSRSIGDGSLALPGNTPFSSERGLFNGFKVLMINLPTASSRKNKKNVCYYFVLFLYMLSYTGRLEMPRAGNNKE